MERTRLILMLTIILLCASLVPGSMALAETFPSKPINLWIGRGAGSASDVPTRAAAEIASKVLKQPILVSNVAGGGGALVLGRLKNAEPDGYTLALAGSVDLSRDPLVQPVPFSAADPLADFVPVYGFYRSVHALVVRSDSPWKTFEEFIAYAKANPGKIKYGTSGAGSGQHLAMEFIARKEKISWSHVPFRGSPAAIAACLGGHVDVVSQTQEWVEHVDAGTMRILVCLNEKRMPRYPQIPTLKEKGYDFEVISITVVYAPAKTPKDRVALLSKVFREASDTDVVKNMLKKFGLELELYDSEELIRIIKKDYAANKVLMKELGLGIQKGN